MCTRNGSLVVVFSGPDYVQGFASGSWVTERQRYEGLVAEIEAHRPFNWYLNDRGKINGLWEAYNRTCAPDMTFRPSRAYKMD